IRYFHVTGVQTLLFRSQGGGEPDCNSGGSRLASGAVLSHPSPLRGGDGGGGGSVSTVRAKQPRTRNRFRGGDTEVVSVRVQLQRDRKSVVQGEPRAHGG